MKKYKIAIWALPLLLTACGGGEKKSDDSKLAYNPEINEVNVITLTRTDFPQQLLSNGKVSTSSKASLYFRTTGTVSRLNIQNGQYVSAGAVLAEIDRPDLQLSLESAEIAMEQANLELYDVLAGLGYAAKDTVSVPQDVLEMAKIRSGYSKAKNDLSQARFNVSGTVLKAPFSGRVADLKLKRYEQATSDVFCTILSDNEVDVDFMVMEAEYSFIEKGMPVKVSPFYDQTKSFTGHISAINPVVDKNGQISVKARIKGNSTLIEGMNVKVSVEKMTPNQLVVPRSAVVVRDNMDVLFTYSPDGKAHWVYVNIIASNKDSFVVAGNSDRASELKEGDVVIISSNLNLADGSEVRLANPVN